MKKIIFTILILSISALAQENNFELSGNLSQDLSISSQDYKLDDTKQSRVFKKRSPMLAAGMSVIIPGAGQFYNEDYWKTAIFVTLEVAAIVTAIAYNSKGDDQTTIFENFANSDNGWDVDKYAQWSVDNASRINPQIQEDILMGVVDEQGKLISWNKLNDLETEIGHYYSHRLAPYDDQQYYEMIGKYQQFNAGWADYSDSDYPPDGYVYPQQVTATNTWYADERGKANSYYDISNLAVKILVVNHLISAVEAALSANSYNRSINAEVKMETSSIGYNRIFYPEFNLSYRF